MSRLPMIISRMTGAAGRVSGLAGQILEDRLELLALELREAKIRLVQAWLLACIGVVFSMLGLLLLVLAGVYILPPEWKIYGLVTAAATSLLAGVITFIALSRHLGQKPLAFEQSLAELKKDLTCFSTKN
ncbi:phage holin family protein [Desulfopila sp. IMCC35008]|uniref:phage holin family protein n=1 Tax=Desulfopila sp. IMCC35008 TaxID=2653858 RepID=UPI0013D0CA84|nr:phage holin family protein [Desulfopila sp. IMCC35008]